METQLIQPNYAINEAAGLCLEYTRRTFNLPAVESTANEAFENLKYFHPGKDFPNASVPVWFEWWGNVKWSDGITRYGRYDHVAVRDKDGTVWSSPLSGTGRASFSSVDKLVQAFGGGMKYLGWSEDISGTRVVNIEGDDMIENNDSEYDRWKLATRRLRGGPAADRFTREYFNTNIVGQQSKTVLDNLMRDPEADYREHAGDVGNLAIQGDWWDKLTEQSSVAGLSKVDVDNAVKQAQEALDAVNKLKGE